MDIKQKINELFKSKGVALKVTEDKKDQKFLDATLADGTEVVIEGTEIIEGARVQVMTDEGLVDAPDGEHTLADGTIISTAGGLIVGIETVGEEMPEGEIVDEAAGQEMSEESKFETDLKDIRDKQDLILETLEVMAAAISNKFQEQELKSEELHQTLGEFKAQTSEVVKEVEKSKSKLEHLEQEPKKKTATQKADRFAKRDLSRLEKVGKLTYKNK